MIMKLSDFHYNLPEELIAKHPPKIRGTSRLLVLDRQTGVLQDRKYADLADLLNPGDLIILNNTKVLKSRLLATKANGAKRELIILEKHATDTDWHEHKVLYRGKLRPNDTLYIKNHQLTVTEILDGGLAIVKSSSDLLKLTEKYGRPPLPPYLKRAATPADTKRYQTVFARDPGSAAAPTASLNMTEELLEKLRAKGVQIAYLTLHVGLGTFLPIRVDDLENHKMHAEYFEIPSETIKAIAKAKSQNHRIVAVGTTVARTLEYAASEHQDVLSEALPTRERQWNPTERQGPRVAGDVARLDSLGGADASERTSWRSRSLSGEANIFIYPCYQFKIIDALLTNFHAPKSTVLMLTAAFAGKPHLQSAYDHAIKQNYQFLSYGDSMLII
jgi:S-adenosylmethionine:tRNA ribosyltransferase-isomerase